MLWLEILGPVALTTPQSTDLVGISWLLGKNGSNSTRQCTQST